MRTFARDNRSSFLSKQPVQAGWLTRTMWDNLRIRERERGLGILFVSILAAVFGFSLLALGFPDAAKAAGFACLGIFWAFAVRRLRGLRQSKSQVTPVGPLSPDEKRKARSKLLPSGRRILPPH